MLSTEQPVGPKNVVIHNAYTLLCRALGKAKKAKWRIPLIPGKLDRLKARCDSITLKLAYMVVSINEDEERSVWRELYHVCEGR
jgi:hypothetical protein